MVGIKLESEINKYLGLPYFKNTGKFKNQGDDTFVGKGSAQEIALATIDLANQKNIQLLNLTPQQIYNFQKKHHLGIDCSGLACHLLNFYFDTNLNPRQTSADMLTSPPLSQPINPQDIQTGDLIRQKSGRHLLFILSVNKDKITYIHSALETRGVVIETKKLSDVQNNGLWRINHSISPQSALDRLKD